ncbi:MAG: type II secretion system protein, partial [Azonexus sp.]|nr:type II secretion system protein [Azonexus sp.]
DYGGFSMANVDDPSASNAMAGYTASIAVAAAGAALGLADNAAALSVTVTVTRGGDSFSLTGYRFRYAPRI